MSTTTRLPKSQISFSTTQFQFAHGKLPKGRGGWIFDMTRHDDFGRPVETTQLWAQQGTFGQAKREALEFASLNGFNDIEVAS